MDGGVWEALPHFKVNIMNQTSLSRNIPLNGGQITYYKLVDTYE